jgi:hypothetical protein
MFDPINARFASSCSKNGTKAVATLTTCFGDTSMYSIFSEVAVTKSPAARAEMVSDTRRPDASTFEFACAIMYLSPSIADKNSISLVTRPFTTLR